MSPRPPRAITSLLRATIITVISLVALLASTVSMTCSLVQDYKVKISHVKQLSQLLASSASSPEGVDLVAEQVSDILNSDPILDSIIFYSIDHPIDRTDSNESAWRYALFADTTNINHAVTSRYFAQAGRPDIADNNPGLTADTVEDNTLLGYISIAIDIKAFRKAWFSEFKYILLLVIFLTLFSIYLILKLLTKPVKQFEKLAKVSEEVINNPKLKQLPVLQQSRELQEVNRIKKAMVTQFDRLVEMQKEHDSLKAYEQQLQSKDLSLDVQRSSFQSMITHELKTSLNAIFGGLQLLSNHYLSNEQQDALTIIRKGSQQLDFTLEQIIQLNRIEKGQVGLNLVEFNPLQLISDLMAEFEPIAKQKGLLLTSQITHIDYKLEGDVNKIRLILSALLDNAIKFTKTGKVTIESHLNHFDKNTRWKVSVIDSGIGIEAHYLEDIFTPFFQIDPSINREFEGVGVGLALAKQMAQLLGAVLTVESKPNEGSTFSVTVQLDDWQRQHDKYLLSGVRALYYHQETVQVPLLPNRLGLYGLDIKVLQHVQSVIEIITDNTIDLLLISEDVLPTKAMYLAQKVRSSESASRTLIVYLFDSNERMDILESDLKAAGVDYCQEAAIRTHDLATKLKQWLII
ncbi:sensor histidine kinase [Psychrobacter pygoscelis]|uniref:sensor histidine kinase n=1 Tax=Psychrobacter pygoscelis TaxID=2488563 RepID=UPI0010387720|nr:HAMP domain-containing sensor histidine kinase [Psychrobacter pygoscelis]